MAADVQAAPDPDAIGRLAAMIRRARRALFITGAGVSADSGLPTYRGIGGLYEGASTDDGVSIEEALSGTTLARQPALTWKYIHQIETACRGAGPNAAHEVMAWLSSRMDALWVLTQNVDGFHHRAGSPDVIAIHGDIHQLICTEAACGYQARVQDYAGLPAVPRCPRCGGVLRPAVVLFGEMLPAQSVAVLRRELARGFDLVVSVGTQSVFPYIAAPVHAARAAGADTVEVNPGLTEVSDVVGLRLASRAKPTFEALRHALTLDPP